MPDKEIVAGLREGPRHGSIPRPSYLRRGNPLNSRFGRGGSSSSGSSGGPRATTSYHNGKASSSGSSNSSSSRRHQSGKKPGSLGDEFRCCGLSWSGRRWWMMLSVLATVAVTQQLLCSRAAAEGAASAVRWGAGHNADPEASSRPARRFIEPAGQAERSALVEVVTAGARPDEEGEVPRVVSRIGSAHAMHIRCLDAFSEISSLRWVCWLSPEDAAAVSRGSFAS